MQSFKIQNSKFKIPFRALYLYRITAQGFSLQTGRYYIMEDWQLDFEWLKVRHAVKDLIQKKDLPDLQSILFMIGIQELGMVKADFTKEEKQDLMHIAVCKLLSFEGYYELEGYDADGWPHWKVLKEIPEKGVKNQELLLKRKIIDYFQQLESQNPENEILEN